MSIKLGEIHRQASELFNEKACWNIRRVLLII